MIKIRRRDWLRGSAAVIGNVYCNPGIASPPSERKLAPARVAITLDLEMSRNFPTWESTHWDFEKGNLDQATKQYALDAAIRVQKHSGVIHFFAVGRVLEQADVGWLKEIAQMGHPIGNHTYDHINVQAKRKEDLQFRFQRSPWLLGDRPILELIRENIELTTKAMRDRLGIAPRGFRTPGGFAEGLKNQPEVRSLLKDLGYRWISSLYPEHINTQPSQEPNRDILDRIAEAQVAAQPFVYPDGLIEIPMSPISDIGAFRNGRWKLDWFLRSIERNLHWAIERGAVFDFLAHPSCLGVMDPDFRTLDLICRIVRESQGKAVICNLDEIAENIDPQS